MCTYAAEAMRIKNKYGELHLLDARDQSDLLVQEVTRQGFDLDEGMIVYIGGHFYHGKDALNFISSHGESSSGFMAFCKTLFWSDAVSSLIYPWIRGARNFLLKRKHASRIDNLQLKQGPTFKAVFGSAWDILPVVMKKHYANRPYGDDEVIVEGILDVMCKQPLKFMAPLMKLMGQIPTHTERGVPVTVKFQSDRDTKAFHFNRTFYFKSMKTYTFKSRMVRVKDNEIIEIMKFGLGWRMLYSWDGQKVVLAHKGYGLSLLGHIIPVPLTFILGRGYAEEIAVDDETFDMMTSITHPWWGKIYEYKGRFKVTKEA